MPKNFIILVFMFLMLVSYGQKSTLLQNINFRAKELKHGLNEVGDSLILASDKTIHSVEIFNQDFEKIVDVGANETKIPLTGTPLGRLVVQARMPDKRIIMTLLRHEEIENIPEETLADESALNIEVEREFIYADVVSSTKPILFEYNVALKVKKEQVFIFVPAPKEPEVDISERVITRAAVIPKNLPSIIEHNVALNTKEEQIVLRAIEIPIKPAVETPKLNIEEQPQPIRNSTQKLSSLLNWKREKTSTSSKIFWIAYVVDSGTNSRKSMRLVSHFEADELISKFKLETKSQQGKLNKLTIWEVFDSINFIKEQTENPNYVYSEESELFDVNPYFASID